MTLAELQRAIATHAFYQLRMGRYQVAISLAEAEGVRAALHAAREDAIRTGEGAAIRRQGTSSSYRLAVAPRSELALRHGEDILDETGGFVPGGAVARATGSTDDYLSAICLQCFRFLDSQLDFEPEALTMLLRALGSSKMDERLAAFLGVHHCRRRAVVDWKLHSIARLFTTEDEYKILHLRALLSRAGFVITKRGITSFEFAQLCDRDADGFVTHSDLVTAFRWLGVRTDAELISELIEYLDRRPAGTGPPGMLEQRHLLLGLPNVDVELLNGGLPDAKQLPGQTSSMANASSASRGHRATATTLRI